MKRYFVLLIALVMLVSILPAGYASETEEQGEEPLMESAAEAADEGCTEEEPFEEPCPEEVNAEAPAPEEAMSAAPLEEEPVLPDGCETEETAPQEGKAPAEECPPAEEAEPVEVPGESNTEPEPAESAGAEPAPAVTETAEEKTVEAQAVSELAVTAEEKTAEMQDDSVLTETAEEKTTEAENAPAVTETADEKTMERELMPKAAQTGPCGDSVTWTLSSGTLTVSGSGAIYDYNDSPYCPWFDLADTVKKIVVSEGITSIGNYTFWHCKNATEVSLPSTLKEIGECAFSNCKALKSIVLPAGIETLGSSCFGSSGLTSVTVPGSVKNLRDAFTDCRALTSATLEEGITEIGDSAFWSCTRLKNITLPGTLRIIGMNAFRSCGRLENITFPNGLETISGGAFAEAGLINVVFPEGLRSVESGAFKENDKLKSVYIPASAEHINGSAFALCSALESFSVDANNAAYRSEGGVLFNKGMTVLYQFPPAKACEKYAIPETVTCMGDESNGWSGFQDCCAVQEICFPKGVMSICRYCFDSAFSIANFTVDPENSYYCSISGILYNKDVTKIIAYPPKNESKELIIPDGITVLAEGAFIGCKAEYIYIPDSVVSYAESPSGQFTFAGCENLKKIRLSANAKTLNYGMFSYIETLEEVELPEGITSLNGAFTECYGLKRIALPGTMNMVGGYDFFNCRSLEEVLIPEGVTVIDANAFCGCSSLRSITLPASLESIEGAAFADCSKLEHITLPAGMTVIPEMLFSGCKALQEICIPAGVKEIGMLAFAGCESLTRIELPYGLKTVGDCAFSGCTELSEALLPQTVTKIGYNAFLECMLKKIYIPAGVTEIGTYAFYGNEAKKVYFMGDAPSVSPTWDSTPSFDEGTVLCRRDGTNGWSATYCGYKTEVWGYTDGDHIWDEGVTIQYPTELEDGIRQYTCYLCGEKKEEKIPAFSGTLTGITIAAKPHKTVYEPGEEFRPQGLIVEGTFSDGRKTDVTAQCTFDLPDMELSGSKTVMVRCTIGQATKTATFTIRVKKLVRLDVVAQNVKEYDVGEQLDEMYLYVIAIYDDDTSTQLQILDPKPYTITGFDSSKPGKCTVTV